MKNVLIVFFLFMSICVLSQDRVGINTNTPGSTLSVKGETAIGTNYSSLSAPTNGVIIEGTVGVGTSSPDSSALLDLSAANKGLLVPRVQLTGASDATTIPAPANSLLIWHKDVPTVLGLQGSGFYYNNGSPFSPNWVKLITTDNDNQSLSISGTVLSLSNGGSVNLPTSIGPQGPTGPAGPTGATGFLSSGSAAGNTPYWDGTAWITTSSNLYNNGGNVGIGTTSPAQKLDVNGKIRMQTGATAGFVPVSDANGTMTWTNPGSIETDPQVSSATTNKVPKWNGITLVDGTLYDNGTNIGIATASPAAKLDIAGNIKITDGTQADGRILKSDPNGLASWQDLTGISLLSSPAPANRSCPVSLTSVSTDANPGSVFVSGNYAYVVNSNGNTMQVINISNPALPTVVGSVATGTNPSSVFVSGNYAYVTSSADNTLQIINISNPASPTMTSSFPTGSGPLSVAVSGSYAYVVNGNDNTMQVIDVSISASPTVLGTVIVGNSPNSVTVSGNYAYVTDLNLPNPGDIKIINISNPSAPVVTGTATLAFAPRSVVVSGNYAYVVHSGNVGANMQIINISNPALPALLGSVATGANPYSVVVLGSYAYVTNRGSNTMTVVDISNAASPTIAGSVGTGNSPRSIAVSGNYTYVANYSSNTLQVINLACSANFNMVVNPATGQTTAAPIQWNTLGNNMSNANSGNVGIGTGTNPPAQALDVNGKIRMQSGAAIGYVPVSDAGGTMTWTNPASLNISINETDPKVGSATANAIPKWNGTSLVDGTVFDNGNVGIGTTTPTAKLDVNGDALINSLTVGRGGGNILTNVTLGLNSLSSNTTGLNNTAVGSTALGNNTTGSYNTAIGNAMQNNTTGIYNVAVGEGALASNTNGSQNIAIGKDALGSNAGSRNIAIGTIALSGNTSGEENTAVGAKGLSSNNIGVLNSAFGSNALFWNVDGVRNSAFGAYALNNNISGTRNTAGGSYALYYATGSYNTGLGYKSLFSDTTGSNNTAIGAFADVSSINLTNATAIGYNAKVAASNAMVLGGTGVYAVKVGIGTTTPTQTLDVNGQIRMQTGATAGYVPVSDASGTMIWTNPTSLSITETDPQVGSTTTNKVPKWNGTSLVDGLVFDNGTNVGIGTTTPANKLDVEGGLAIGASYSGTATAPANGAIIQGNVGIGTSSPTAKLDVNGDASINGVAIGRGAGNNIENTALGSLALNLNSSGSVNTAVGVQSLYGNTTGSDNVGVGSNTLLSNATGSFNTAAGTYALAYSTGSYNTGFGKNALLGNTTGSYNTALGYDAGVSAGNLTNATAIGYNAKVSASNSLVLGGTGADAVKVGIGVTSPTNTLDIEGGLAVGATYSGTSAAPANGAIIEGNVGIGTSSPNSQLHLNNASNVGPQITLSAPGGGTPGIAFRPYQSSGQWSNPAQALISATDNNYSADIHFWTKTPGALANALTERMTIQNSGNVGIGTTIPASTLDVNGSVSVATSVQTGSYTLTSSDYCVIFTGASGTFTLPAASSSTGRIYLLVNQGTAALTTSTIKTGNVTTSTSVTAGTTVQIISDGTNWRKIN